MIETRIADGCVKVECDDRTIARCLIPGEVIVWRHPGLRAGEYLWDGVQLSLCHVVRDEAICSREAALFLRNWTDPPRVGKWLVREGQEYAVWEGE